ncbi:MAG: hypothetical protein COY19_12285 [Candidatus Marinimicrobia bacterium CG_4_10_14_0_2_um_filter_48_9]|nr:MAG: hypothetical protein COY19_12285 [Candidatus Marinimicrobia bacterium CG_4_10_14_0_2_um_filter_48_9]
MDSPVNSIMEREFKIFIVKCYPYLRSAISPAFKSCYLMVFLTEAPCNEDKYEVRNSPPYMAKIRPEFRSSTCLRSLKMLILIWLI